MKVLRLNTCFALPDDFEGGVNEALEELIKYRKNKNISNLKKNEEPAPNWEDMTYTEQWNYFCESVQKGFNHVGSGYLVDLD